MSLLTLSFLQTPLHWENAEANREMFAQKIAALPATHWIILPEMFNTGFTMNPHEFAETMDGATVAWMREQSYAKKAVICGSIPVEEEGVYYNRLIWMLPNGEYGYYDKRHLFAFAGEHREYSPGARRLVARINGFRILLLVCYDLRFPVWSRQQQKQNGPEYDILLYVANWPERRSHAWRTLLQARAIENQCYVVGVNRIGEDGNGISHSGNSMVVDMQGEILCEFVNEEMVHTLTLERTQLDNARSKFPFLADGDDFTVYH